MCGLLFELLLGETEAEHLDLMTLVNHDVRRLRITVNDAVRALFSRFTAA